MIQPGTCSIAAACCVLNHMHENASIAETVGEHLYRRFQFASSISVVWPGVFLFVSSQTIRNQTSIAASGQAHHGMRVVALIGTSSRVWTRD
jgi:hypothetical protein